MHKNIYKALLGGKCKVNTCQLVPSCFKFMKCFAVITKQDKKQMLSTFKLQQSRHFPQSFSWYHAEQYSIDVT